jgi:hypothetical protein
MLKSKLRTMAKQISALGAPVFILATSLTALFAHAYLGSYSRFMADDYCSAAESRRLGILRAVWFWYRTWNGRYSAGVLDALFGYWGPAVTPAVTAFALIAWFAALTGAIYFVLASSSLAPRALWSAALAAAVLFMTLALAPDVAQSLYWGQGMRSVIPPLILLTCYVFFFCWYRSRLWSVGSGNLWMVSSFALTYVAGGFSETYTALQLATLSLALALFLIYREAPSRRGDLLFLGFGLLGAVLSFITVVAAPGNSYRQAFYPPPPPLLDLLRISLTSFAAFLGHLFDSAPKVLSLIGALAIGIWIGTFRNVQVYRARGPFLVLVLGALLIFSCFPPAAYGQSDAPPDRTLIIPVYILMLTIALLGVTVGNLLSARPKSSGSFASLAILLLLAAGTISVYQTMSLRPAYVAYANAWERFHAQMVAYGEAGVASAEISTADMNSNNWAGLNVIGDNPKFWLNICVSDYYGVRVISNDP